MPLGWRLPLALVVLGALLVGACGAPVISARPVAPSGTVSHAGTPEPAMTEAGALRFVALGDSFTIGTSVAEAERWPNQLVAQLPELALAGNLAVNGFTSRDVLEVELPQLPALRPEFVTLLIGVNDVVQGVPAEAYRQNLRRILDDVVSRVGANRVIAVTTPDYTVTPAGADYGDPATQSAAIRQFNAILREVALIYAVPVVDVYELSLAAGEDRSLVASDGLHPSGAQYALWAAAIAPAVIAQLDEEDH